MTGKRTALVFVVGAVALGLLVVAALLIAERTRVRVGVGEAVAGAGVVPGGVGTYGVPAVSTGVAQAGVTIGYGNGGCTATFSQKLHFTP